MGIAEEFSDPNLDNFLPAKFVRTPQNMKDPEKALKKYSEKRRLSFLGRGSVKRRLSESPAFKARYERETGDLMRVLESKYPWMAKENSLPRTFKGTNDAASSSS